MVRHGKKIIIQNQLLAYWCPGCDELHQIRVNAGDKGWKLMGTEDAPTIEPSVNVVGRCHHWIRNGQVEFLNDCTHAAAGKTIALPDFPDDFLDWFD